jgi:putative chitinase
MLKGIKNWLEVAKTVSEVLAEKKLLEKEGITATMEDLKSIAATKVNPVVVEEVKPAVAAEVKPEPVVVESPKVEQKPTGPVMSPRGDPKVFELQKELIAKGAKITADGLMGPATKKAQQQFAEKPVTSDTAPAACHTASAGDCVTADLLKKLFPTNKNCDALCTALCTILPKYEINTPNRIAAFLAQCGHESGGFTVLQENLNYSAEGLRKIFPSRFATVAAAQPYHRQPEKIANKIYCDRMGNGPESSGEGYKFRGRGAIQLTGKENYSNFAKSIGKSLDETVAYCETLEGAICSAAWFWTTRKLNVCADCGDILSMTKKINGGTIGLEDRKKHYEHALYEIKKS